MQITDIPKKEKMQSGKRKSTKDRTKAEAIKRKSIKHLL